MTIEYSHMPTQQACAIPAGTNAKYLCGEAAENLGFIFASRRIISPFPGSAHRHVPYLHTWQLTLYRHPEHSGTSRSCGQIFLMLHTSHFRAKQSGLKPLQNALSHLFLCNLLLAHPSRSAHCPQPQTWLAGYEMGVVWLRILILR
jgi:hypothetical protein